MKDIDMRIRGSAIALTNPTESKLLDGRSGVPTLGTRWLMGTRSDSSGRFTRAAGYPVRGLFVHADNPRSTLSYLNCAVLGGAYMLPAASGVQRVWWRACRVACVSPAKFITVTAARSVGMGRRARTFTTPKAPSSGSVRAPR